MYDPWLRGKGDHWVSSSQVEGVYHLVVKDLLLESYKAWDIAKIRNLFTRLVVDEIIATPLISSVKEDKVLPASVGRSCPVCNVEVKDDVHVFFGCVAAGECWSAAVTEPSWKTDVRRLEQVVYRPPVVAS
ncbi:hypothetical protein L195_g033048 [Trifolium pratense]|nr:hypothetical protein L195_g033048 [Trifolium pratense]